MTDASIDPFSLANLLLAYEKAAKGKRRRPDVAAFELDLEVELINLRAELVERRYQPSAFREFVIYDRKPRSICAAPFRDRVVHHAAMNLLGLNLERKLSAHCYACRQGKGAHAAVARYQHAAKHCAYALKLDISSYFPSIDHSLLKEQLARLTRDLDLLWLLHRIIDASPEPVYAPAWSGADLVDLMQRRSGIPIGNLTSQHFGNLYLNDIDHWLDGDIRVCFWLRYVDDLIILGNDKQTLWGLLEELRERLAVLRLSIHPRKCELFRTSDGIDVLGYRVWPRLKKLRRDNGYRYRRHLRKLAAAYNNGHVQLADVNSSVAAWLGHTRHADANALEREVLSSVSFVRGNLS